MKDHTHNLQSSDAAPIGAERRGTRSAVKRTVMAVLLVSTFFAGAGVERFHLDGSDDANASSSFVDSPAFATLQSTWDLIHDTYIDESSISDEALIYGAASGMVESLGDTGHSTFLDPDQAKMFQSANDGNLIGIGVELDFQDGRPVVISPIEGSPADAAGVGSRDVILAVDGVDTKDMSQSDLFAALRGAEGTSVEVTFQRASDDSTYTVTLVRSKITVEPVTWTMLPGKVALIRLSAFSRGATDAVKAALKEANAQGATSMILDLRDNPGGLVLEAIGVASQFLPEGTPIYQLQERGEEPRPVRTTGIGLGTELPLVVLVNGGSASSAEIVASAVQDNGRGELVGETTFGTGTVLTPNLLEDGSMVVLGTGFWLTANGQQLWHIGVTPANVVEQADGDEISRTSELAKVTETTLESINDSQLLFAYNSLLPSAVGN